MNWRKTLIEAAIKADEERFVKHVTQLARGVITREDFMAQLAVAVIKEVEVADASDELQKAVIQALLEPRQAQDEARVRLNEAKPKSWHSRRHETSEAQDEARVRYHRTSGKAARQAKALLRNLVRWFHP